MHLLIFILLLATCKIEGGRFRRQLYFPGDDVQILSAHNFKKSIQNSPKGWLVEFYVSWCGDCIRFAPVWKQLAKETIGWQDLVRLAVIDCSDPINLSICREYEIVKYPTIKYFHEGFKFEPGDHGTMVLEEDKTIDAKGVKKLLVKRLIQEQLEGRGAQYPGLVPFTKSSPASVLEGLPKGTKFIFVVFENPDQYLGQELAMDLFKTPKIVFRQAYSDNTILMKLLRVSKIPALVGMNLEKNFKVFQKNVNSREKMKKKIRHYLRKTDIELVEDKTIKDKNKDIASDNEQHRKRGVLREYFKRMGDVVFQGDLEAALRWALQREVPTMKSIKGEHLKALNTFLIVIKKYFPLGYKNTGFIEELVNATSEADNISGEAIQQIAKKARFSSPERFFACEGSTKSFRGYPCSLWKLFHYLTVNAVLKNLNNRRANPIEVLSAMHGYIKNFFGCRVCSNHFQAMAGRRKIFEVSSMDDSIMWLWEAHNEVNNRLAGDATEDPEFPKYQFPSKIFCPECYNQDNSWNKNDVMKYLTRMYNSYNVRYIGTNTTLLFPAL